jgi:hypothetical protein
VNAPDPSAGGFLDLGKDVVSSEVVDGETTETSFVDVEEWVRLWLAPALAPHLTGDGRGLVFCERWWAHNPVVIRVHALWQAWEQARRAGTMSTWWVSHADPNLRAVCDGETGPMRHCGPGHHIPTRTLVVVAAPAGWQEHTTYLP